MNKKIASALSLMSFVMFQLSAKPMSFASTNPGVSGWVKAVLIAVGTFILGLGILYILFFEIFIEDFDITFTVLVATITIIVIFIIASFFVFPTLWCGFIGGGIAVVFATFWNIYINIKVNKHDAHLIFEANKVFFMKILELIGGEDNIASIQRRALGIEVELKTNINNNKKIGDHCKGVARYSFDGILLNLDVDYGYGAKIYGALELAIEETRAEKEKQRQNEEKKEEDERRMKNQLKEQRDGVLAQQKETEQQREEENRQLQLEKLIKKVKDDVLRFQSSVDKKESVNLQLLKMIEDALSEMQSCKNRLEKHDIEELKRNKIYCNDAFERAKKLEGFTQSAKVRMDEILKMFDDVAK